MKKYAYILLFLCLINITHVKAESNNTIDFNKKGSIEITLSIKEEETKIEGASITIYKVAHAKEENHNLIFEYTNEFSSCQASLKNLETNSITSEIDKCLNNNIKGTTLVTNKEGTVTFNDLELGLYLVKQTSRVENYSQIEPFLVMLPRVIDNKWEYNIKSKPKTDINRVIDITVKKVWNLNNSNTSGEINVPKSVEIALLLDEELIDKVILNKDNNWTHTWKYLQKSDKYRVLETKVPKGYTATYWQEDNLFIVTNTKTLVYTGQMRFLVEILSSIGIIFIIASLIYNKVSNE